LTYDHEVVDSTPGRRGPVAIKCMVRGRVTLSRQINHFGI